MNISPEAVLELIINGAILGAISGLVMGAIAWTINQRHSQLLILMLGGAAVGFLVGLYFESETLIPAFRQGVTEILNRPGEDRTDLFFSVIRLLQFVLGGMAIGGAITSIGRALIGSLSGLVLGTLAGIFLIIANNQLTLGFDGPILSVAAAAVTLAFIVLISIGQSEPQ